MQDPNDDNPVGFDQIEDEVAPEHQPAQSLAIKRHCDRICFGLLRESPTGLPHLRDKGHCSGHVIRRDETTNLCQILVCAIGEEALHPRLLFTPERLFQTIKNIVGGSQIAGLHIRKTFA